MRLESLTNSRILIVDDQTVNLRVLAGVLEFAGYPNVHCLNDSRNILETFREFQPDVILLDLHMPHVDGIAAMDLLATVIPEDDYVPILVLTGDGTAEAKEKVLSHGAHDFLSKPLNRTEVQLRVKNLLETRHLHLQLKSQNASLEQQVRERTELAEELGRSNEKLKETQAHLIHSEKMAGLGQLVAGIAHEINNPLAFVINNIFIVQEGLGKLAVAPDLPAGELARVSKMQARINDAQAGATRVKDLVTKLRTFSRLDEGTVKTINIHESIESVLLFLRHKMEDRIEVERQYGDVEMLTCLAGELNQVLMNLIANAIDAIDGPGRITLATGQQNGDFVIRVRDTGKGISDEIRNRIFEPFFTTKPIGEGTGLGLAISYGIIKAHNGSMEFSTKAGEGTEFILKIPTTLRLQA
ncbi:MAG: response regulator [Bryobacterales bacterium]|nr:response regulator [Bryobacterales bacterium]